MEDDDIVGSAVLLVLPVIPDMPGRPGIIQLDEDLRPVAPLLEHALDLEHLIRDGVAVAEGCGELMDVH
jgi:hypothetical protein